MLFRSSSAILIRRFSPFCFFCLHMNQHQKINTELKLVLLFNNIFAMVYEYPICRYNLTIMENHQYKILLVDDEEDVLEFVGYNLKREGYEVFTAKNGKEALKIAREKHPHLTLLDVMMPEMDGMETCEEMRKIPVIKDSLIVFLTARGEDYSQISGFDAGADDYVTKPIKPKVLISRIKALLRRQANPSDSTAKERSNRIVFDNLIIDKDQYLITYEGKDITLPKKEFELISLLCEKPNKVFTRDEIFTQIWGDNVIVGDRTIDVHVRKIREKVGLKNIKTVKGVGYKFET